MIGSEPIGLAPNSSIAVDGAPDYGPRTAAGRRPDTEQRLQQELIRAVYQNGQLANVMTFVALPVIALLLWRQSSSALFFPWLAAIAVVTLLRALYLYLAQANEASPHECVRLRRNFLLWNFASGATWGAAALLATLDPLPNLVFIAFTLGGVTAVAVVVHGAMFSAVALFTIPALLPLAARLLLQQTQPFTAMGIATALFACVLLVVAARMGKTSLRALRLGIINEDLIKYLEIAKRDTDHLNTVLTTEVAERRHIERQLRTEHDFVSAILDTECGLVMVLDPDGTLVRFNRACELATGYYAHEVIGRTIWDTLILPNEAAYLRLKLDAVLAGSFPNECELRWRMKHRGERRVRLSNTALLDKHGKPTHIVATGVDLTEHYIAESELARSREDFRLLVEGVSTYAIYMLDTEGLITSWNSGAERITGYKATEIIGTHFSRLYAVEDAQRGRPAMQLRMAASDGRFEYEGWNVRKDNGMFWASITISPVRAPDQSLRGFSVITGDLTERKQTEDTIRALLSISEQLNATLDMEVLMDSLAHQALKLLDARSGYAALFHAGHSERGDSQHGEPTSAAPGQPKHTTGLPAHVRQTRKPYRTNDASRDTLAETEFYRARGVHAAICCPILNYDGEAIGFIEVHDKNNDAAFSAIDEERLVSVSQSASLAIQNALAYEQITRTKNLLSEEARLMEMIATGASVAQVMSALLASVEAHIEDARAVFLFTAQEPTLGGRYLTSAGTQPELLPTETDLPSSPFLSIRMATDQAMPAMVEVTDDAQWRTALDSLVSTDSDGCRYWLYPIRGNASSAIGVLAVLSPAGSEHQANQPAVMGTVLHLAGIAIERHCAEEGLRLRERAIESSVNAILVASAAHADHPIIYTNPAGAAITGLRASQLLGRGLLSLYGHSDTEDGLARLRRALDTREEAHAVVHGTRGDCGDFWAEVFISPVRDKSGVVGHFVAVMHDISDRIYAEEELRQSRERLRALSIHLQSVREEEKAHLARELHDELGSTLLALKIDASWIKRHLPDQANTLKEKAAGMNSLIDTAITTTRRISSGLRPPMLDDLGLLATLDWQINEYQSRMGITCETTLSGDSEYLDSQQSITLFRIFQEALTNIARHANASKVQVHVDVGRERAVMTISDNGRGLDPAAARRPDAHGVHGMYERVRALGGTIELHGAAGTGTRLAVEIPLTKPITH